MEEDMKRRLPVNEALVCVIHDLEETSAKLRQGERRAARSRWWKHHGDTVKTTALTVIAVGLMVATIFLGVERMDEEDQVREAMIALGDFEPLP
jgi:hypothetical protein